MSQPLLTCSHWRSSMDGVEYTQKCQRTRSLLRGISTKEASCRKNINRTRPRQSSLSPYSDRRRDRTCLPRACVAYFHIYANKYPIKREFGKEMYTVRLRYSTSTKRLSRVKLALHDKQTLIGNCTNHIAYKWVIASQHYYDKSAVQIQASSSWKAMIGKHMIRMRKYSRKVFGSWQNAVWAIINRAHVIICLPHRILFSRQFLDRKTLKYRQYYYQFRPHTKMMSTRYSKVQTHKYVKNGLWELTVRGVSTLPSWRTSHDRLTSRNLLRTASFDM